MARWRLLVGLTMGAATGLLPLAVGADEPPPLSAGQTVYVPVYSHILQGNVDGRGKPGQVLLSSMLSVRNVDPDSPVTLRSVRYFDTEGRPLREYLAAPQVLGPMASSEFFIEHQDREGGSGANFLVIWSAAAPVNQPLLETVNAYFFGTQSMAFTSRGQVLRLKETAAKR